MLLKSADDKSKRLALLENLQQSPLLDFTQKKWLREELLRLKKGLQGEKDSAYYLDSYFKDGVNHVVLHDLRLVLDGEVAQIDHLIINRAFGIYLIETKNYSGNLSINDLGEFTAQYDDYRFGIPSPLEQSHRHARILSRLLERLEITGRTQKELEFHNVVMLHPKSIITRPSMKAFDSSNVIKADQFPSWHSQYTDKLSVGSVFKLALNIRGLDTIKDWAEKLVRQHRPADLLALPDFMQPKPASKQQAPLPKSPSAMMASHAALEVVTGATVNATSPEPAKRLICAKCGAKISFPEGKFCWNNSTRFGGLQYCRDHQAMF
jgi:hypothetical protein